ncbi:protein tipE [Anabrus simplex]|uniref:protein tipE n=1 Tax=Anabrus simplex TaxID=316456 RepID=UPI0035A3317B
MEATEISVCSVNGNQDTVTVVKEVSHRVSDAKSAFSDPVNKSAIKLEGVFLDCVLKTVNLSVTLSNSQAGLEGDSGGGATLLINERLSIDTAFTIDPDESTVIMGAQQQDGAGDDEEENPYKLEVLMEKAKFYTSLCMGTTAILSVFAFLFLIPFVVDPAISTIMSDFDPEAVTCITVQHVYAEGLRNCSWSSCREGCTTAALKCHQILVNYSKTSYNDYVALNVSLADKPDLYWDVGDTKFYINTEGCGYPPRVNCSEFAKQYGYGNLFKPFPCYYSRTYPEVVVARYSWDDNLRHLVLSLVVPNVVFAVSIGVLCYWYCPSCNRACNKKTYVEKYVPKEEENEDEDDYFEEEEY